MATRAEDFPGRSAVAGAPPPPAARVRAAALRSRAELRPGLVLAFFYAWALAMARLIDVSEDGKAMLPFTVTDQMPPGTYNVCVCLAWRSDIRFGMPGPCTPLFPLKVLPAAGK